MKGIHPENPPLDLVPQVLKQSRLIYASVKQHFREVERASGVSGAQLWLLQEIRSKLRIGVSDLAAQAPMHQSTCSTLVDKLCSLGLVVKTRIRDDQRRASLSLTQASTSLLAGVLGPAERILPSALKALPDVALSTLHVNLDNLIRNLPVRDEPSSDRPLADL
jgi:DNA-binding MarR family transcriptional regulator